MDQVRTPHLQVGRRASEDVVGDSLDLGQWG